MSFVRRKIAVTFQYGTGDDGFGAPLVTKTADLTGLRMSADAVIAGGAGMGQLQLRIYGMTLSLMNALSTIGKLPVVYRKNTVIVSAGDDVTGMAQIYQGTIIAAWADMNAAPEVAFNVTAAAGLLEALLPIPASSYPESADVAVILSNLVNQINSIEHTNLVFENSGVSVILDRPYFPGSARQQAAAAVRAAGIEWNGIENGILAIWPRGGARGGAAQEVSTEKGMVGYPAYTATGIIAKSIFLPTVRFGALVDVKSTLTPANGRWRIVTLQHNLESEMPNGQWFTQMQLAKPELVVVTR